MSKLQFLNHFLYVIGVLLELYTLTCIESISLDARPQRTFHKPISQTHSLQTHQHSLSTSPPEHDQNGVAMFESPFSIPGDPSIFPRLKAGSQESHFVDAIVPLALLVQV